MGIEKYEDIIDLPHPEPKNHPRMSDINRAAQFAPFAALTGYDDEIEEAGRLTDREVSLDDNNKDILDHKLMIALENKTKAVSIKYFVPDERKSGGKYTYVTECVKRFDSTKRCVVLDSGTEILIDRIVDIEFVDS